MIRHFFLDKTNSIFEGSLQNVGINPVLHIGYGKSLMRGLLHFDTCQVGELIKDKTFANIEKLKITLKMTNCFSIDGLPYEKNLINPLTRRAASFDLMLTKLPCDWDAGRGFDFISDFWVKNNRSYSQEASNWYCPKDGLLWPYEADLLDLNNPELNWAEFKINKFGAKGGVYPMIMLKEEYEKYLDGEDSLVVGVQHFDFGNENLEIDVTDYVMGAIKSGNNPGLLLSFTPRFENMNLDNEEYVGFVTDKTNTFFHPYIEVEYDDFISDDRESFTIGKKNKLCLYVSDNGEMVNLDEVPTCSVNGTEAEVRQITKGVYEATVSSDGMSENAIYYDTWSNILLDGEEQDDIELEFATNPKERKIKIGTNVDIKRNFVPSIYGINDDEKLGRGETREVTVDFRKQYETEKRELIDGAMFRLYVKDADRDIDIINYHPIEKGFLYNYFMIHTEDLIPNEYYIDIRIKTGREIKYFKRVLKFTVVSNVTERYN